MCWCRRSFRHKHHHSTTSYLLDISSLLVHILIAGIFTIYLQHLAPHSMSREALKNEKWRLLTHQDSIKNRQAKGLLQPRMELFTKNYTPQFPLQPLSQQESVEDSPKICLLYIKQEQTSQAMENREALRAGAKHLWVRTESSHTLRLEINSLSFSRALYMYLCTLDTHLRYSSYIQTQEAVMIWRIAMYLIDVVFTSILQPYTRRAAPLISIRRKQLFQLGWTPDYKIGRLQKE